MSSSDQDNKQRNREIAENEAKREMVSNVRVKPREDSDIDVTAVFATYRTKDGVTDLYFGSSSYRLMLTDGTFKIRSKRCVLDTDALRPSGRISIVL